MSILLDKLIFINTETETKELVDDKKYSSNTFWVYTKPLSLSFSIQLLWSRFKDAWRILSGKAIAVHYWEDSSTKEKYEYIWWRNVRSTFKDIHNTNVRDIRMFDGMSTDLFKSRLSDKIEEASVKGNTIINESVGLLKKYK